MYSCWKVWAMAAQRLTKRFLENEGLKPKHWFVFAVLKPENENATLVLRTRNTCFLKITTFHRKSFPKLLSIGFLHVIRNNTERP